MARFSYWNDFKEAVHEQGVTLSQLAAAAHVSVSTLKRHYDGREIDSDFDAHITEMLRECAAENENEKIKAVS